ncbi:MAG: hypothetical protein JXB08_02045 [Bacilli bacterium]|nr:hypothetical protein [Bacilli bacterium]MBN2876226.1 hypothetical protein [Bacilli bacterium]
MKRKSLILSITSLVLIITSVLILGFTFGWGFDSIDLNTGTISVGDLRYSQDGDFITNGTIMYPGMELVNTSFTLTNESPITSQMRLKIAYTKVEDPQVGGVTTYYTGAVDDHLAVTFDSTFVNSGDYWYYNSDVYEITANSGQIDLLSSISYDGNLVGNDYAQVSCAITITIEVKQNDNVTWSELTSYDFETGYPA